MAPKQDKPILLNRVCKNSPHILQAQHIQKKIKNKTGVTSKKKAMNAQTEIDAAQSTTGTSSSFVHGSQALGNIKKRLRNYDSPPIKPHVLVCAEMCQNIYNENRKEYKDDSRFVRKVRGDCDFSEGHNIVFDLYWDEVDSLAILVIKGTDNLLEWIINASFYIRKFDEANKNHPGLFVHVGWHTTAEDVHRRVMNDFPKNMKKLIITGHSLGGSCGQILTEIIKLKETHVKIICCTFGAPTPFYFSPASCKDFGKEDMYNYAFNSDPVPSCPYKLADEKFRKALYKAAADKYLRCLNVVFKIEEEIHKRLDFPLAIKILLKNYQPVGYKFIEKNQQNDIKIDHHGMEYYVDEARKCKDIYF